MKSAFKIVLIVLALLTIRNTSGNRELWCYECNVDLEQGPTGECNDPYSPAPSADLVACPRDDSYVCLKSLIFYRSVHVTVRGCVPRSTKSTYCSFKKAYSNASLECLFCDDNACNGSHRSATSWTNRYVIVASFIIVLASLKILDIQSLIT